LAARGLGQYIFILAHQHAVQGTRPVQQFRIASGLQELHDANASPRLVAEETRRQRRPRQTPPTRAPQTRLATRDDLGMPD